MLEAVLAIPLVAYSIILHEISHGWIADRLGDPTARLSGRLTLDPRPHIDPLMTIGLPIITFLLGGVVFGAAKPVPIDPFNFRQPKKDTALTAAAGPIVNLLIALFFAILFRLPIFNILDSIFLFVIQVNVFLAVFNLLPIPPLDGFKVVGGLIPDQYQAFWNSLERFGLTFILIAFFFFNTIISTVILPVSRTILKILLP